MKSFRSTIILALIVAILCALSVWAYFRREHQQQNTSEKKIIGNFKPETIRKISVHTASSTIDFEKNSDRFSATWWVAGEEGFPADYREVQFILEKFSGLKADRLVENTSKNISEFGLQNPRMTIEFSGTQASPRFLVGNATPFGKELFLKLENDPRIFIVTDDFFERLSRKRQDFQKYYFLEPHVLETNEITFESPQKSWTAHNAGNHWEIVEGKKLFLDKEQVIDTLLEGLKEINIESRPSLSLKEKQSAFKITFSLKSGQPLTVLFFDPPEASKAGLIYATFPPEPFVYGLNRILVERLQSIPEK